MDWGRLRRLCARWWVSLLAGALLAAYLVWRFLYPSPAASLFQYLPRDHAVHAYVDSGRILSSPAARRFLAEGDGMPAGLREAARLLSAESAEAEAIAFSLGEGVIRMAARGPFSEPQLVQALRGQGAACPALRGAVCTVPSTEAGRELAVTLWSDDLLAAADRKQSGQDLIPPEHGAGALAEEAPKQLAGGAYVWAVIDPPALDRVMRDPPESWINLTVVARSLVHSERAYLSLEPGVQGLELLLEAPCANEEKAQKLYSLLTGLNQFLAAAAGMGEPESSQGPWPRVLRPPQFTQRGATVHVRWLLDAETLRGLARRGG